VVKIDPYANIKEQKAKKNEIMDVKKKEIDSTWCHASQIEVYTFIYVFMYLNLSVNICMFVYLCIYIYICFCKSESIIYITRFYI
jgi:hypothetical protein